MLARMWRERISFALLVGMQTGAVGRFLKKLKIELPYDPAIALLGIYPREYRYAVSKEHMHPHVYSSTINSQSMQEAQTSIMDNEWIKKM